MVKRELILLWGLISSCVSALHNHFELSQYPWQEYEYDAPEYRAGFDEGSNLDEESDFVAVSLGSDCNTAFFLRDYHLRPYAFPFDWCITPYNALSYFIKNDFIGFFEKENLIPGAKSTWLMDKESGMIFPHDFPDNSIETLNENYDVQKRKYVRRIKRFYEKINSGKHVYFIRWGKITKSGAFDLYALLQEKFPAISFNLIAIGIDESQRNEFSKEWDHPHIKNYFCLRNSTKEDKKLFWDMIYKHITNKLG